MFRWAAVFILLLSLSTFAAGKKKITDFQPVGDDDSENSETADAKKIAESIKEVKPKLNDNEETLTGTVSVMRRNNNMTEAFFKDLKESYFVPSGSKNYEVFKALQDSSKKGTKVTFKANKKSRQVISLEDAPATLSPAAAGSGAK
jgi:hypothetical protein